MPVPQGVLTGLRETFIGIQIEAPHAIQKSFYPVIVETSDNP